MLTKWLKKLSGRNLYHCYVITTLFVELIIKERLLLGSHCLCYDDSVKMSDDTLSRDKSYEGTHLALVSYIM